MRILADVRLLSRGGTSGIEEYTRNLLGAVFAADKNNRYSLFYNGLRKVPLGIEGAGIVDWRLPNKLLDLSSRFINAPAVDHLTGSDLVFSPHFNILKTAKAPRVITFHDLSFLHHPYFFSAKQRFWHWLQGVRRQASEAAKIIAVSEFTKSDLVNLLGVTPGKVEVVYSGISESFRPLNITSSKKEVRPYFLYLGTLEPRKNVPAIIRAFNLLKGERGFSDWQLVIAGKPGWLYSSILKEALSSPHGKDIIFTGQVKPEDRVLLYNLAKVFVYPSFFEGFGFPPVEAQASGCPVVASDRTSLPEVLGGSALLANPWKVSDLAAAMREAAMDGATRKRLTEAGLKNSARFSWKASAASTISIFNNVR